ncbi:uncharacterized protein LOC105698628 isoform X2 [Orussus abietinus]|uniref:uncharacterized protein LOC105698628 isoform X2 n=1 Tax=Orussus abietinus TaxID=222816 RepID=UPI000626219A|nr:uncharacterized protein LOC105698628 isoform X2 [Orussus abietinus]
MYKRLYLIVACILVIFARENASKKLPSVVVECYNDTYILNKDNRLPHTMQTLIALLRKIEDIEGLNMDSRTLSSVILHRFRRDGIVFNPSIRDQQGVTPYATSSEQSAKQEATLRLIPSNARTFPNESLTIIERCSLHAMLSSSIELFERGDEGTTCKLTNELYRQWKRSVDDDDSGIRKSIPEDVETLTPEQFSEGKPATITVDPNSVYPDLPPNHPDTARFSIEHPRSRCPVENGVIKTRWGAVSAGAVLAGLAAGLQPQTVSVRDVLRGRAMDSGLSEDVSVNNVWLATLAGDLAEMAILQGPHMRNEEMDIGVNGNWNSSTLPRWYFLGSSENLEFTAAEIRGDLDGLIIAEGFEDWDSKVSSLRLSQVFDMYYGPRGVFSPTIRACNRKALFPTAAPEPALFGQAFSASLILNRELAEAGIESSTMQKFSMIAVQTLLNHVETSMNGDPACPDLNNPKDQSRPAVDLTVVLDIDWPFTSIQPVLATLFDLIDVDKYGSNFTLINAQDGGVVIPSTNTILDFHGFNITRYQNSSGGFNLPKVLENVRLSRVDKMNEEQRLGIGGSNSDVVLIIPYQSSAISDLDKEYCMELLKTIYEEAPDLTILFLTYGPKDKWSELVRDPMKDIFNVQIGNTPESFSYLDNVVSRIKQVPKRLINSQCGATNDKKGSSRQFVDYVEPSTVNYYRLHPNYFFAPGAEDIPRIKVQGAGWGTLKVCVSRDAPMDTTEIWTNGTCTSVTGNTHTIELPCNDASLIHECSPVYLSITTTNSTSQSYHCIDKKVCRFPHMIKFTISYENLVCVSSAGIAGLTVPLILILSIILISY